MTAGFNADDPACAVAYSAVSADIFDVAEDFPKLTPSDLPAGILKLSYGLDSAPSECLKLSQLIFLLLWWVTHGEYLDEIESITEESIVRGMTPLQVFFERYSEVSTERGDGPDFSLVSSGRKAIAVV